MAKKPSKKVEKIEDEPGAEDRFLRGVQNALKTPPKPFTPPKKSEKVEKKPKKSKS